MPLHNDILEKNEGAVCKSRRAGGKMEVEKKMHVLFKKKHRFKKKRWCSIAKLVFLEISINIQHLPGTGDQQIRITYVLPL